MDGLVTSMRGLVRFANVFLLVVGMGGGSVGCCSLETITLVVTLTKL